MGVRGATVLPGTFPALQDGPEIKPLVWGRWRLGESVSAAEGNWMSLFVMVRFRLLHAVSAAVQHLLSLTVPCRSLVEPGGVDPLRGTLSQCSRARTQSWVMKVRVLPLPPSSRATFPVTESFQVCALGSS